MPEAQPDDELPQFTLAQVMHFWAALSQQAGRERELSEAGGLVATRMLELFNERLSDAVRRWYAERGRPIG